VTGIQRHSTNNKGKAEGGGVYQEAPPLLQWAKRQYFHQLRIFIRITPVSAAFPKVIDCGGVVPEKAETGVLERLSPEETEARIAASHADIRTMVEYWRSKAGSRRMPQRADIDPVEIKPFLPRITLVDVVPDPRRFVYRLVGTEEVASRGSDPTGRSVADAYFASAPEESLMYYEHVARHAEPCCFRGDYRAPDGALEKQDVIFLPLSEDGETVSMIMVFYYDYRFHPRVEDSSVLLRYHSWTEDEA
jgi:hypothetical protein